MLYNVNILANTTFSNHHPKLNIFKHLQTRYCIDTDCTCFYDSVRLELSFPSTCPFSVELPAASSQALRNSLGELHAAMEKFWPQSTHNAETPGLFINRWGNPERFGIAWNSQRFPQPRKHLQTCGPRQHMFFSLSCCTTGQTNSMILKAACRGAPMAQWLWGRDKLGWKCIAWDRTCMRSGRWIMFQYFSWFDDLRNVARCCAYQSQLWLVILSGTLAQLGKISFLCN